VFAVQGNQFVTFLRGEKRRRPGVATIPKGLFDGWPVESVDAFFESHDATRRSSAKIHPHRQSSLRAVALYRAWNPPPRRQQRTSSASRHSTRPSRRGPRYVSALPGVSWKTVSR